MRGLARLPLLAALLLGACASPAGTPALTPTATEVGARLPTRLPTPTPTATPFPLSAEAYWRRGVQSQRNGERVQAERYFSWALQIDPLSAQAYISRGALLLGQDELDGALRDAEAALEIEQTASGYRLRAEAERRLGEYERALASFDQALARDSSLRDETFVSRWRAARALDDVDRLSSLGDEYARDQPDDPLRHYYRAWPSYRAEQYDGVIDSLVEGIGESPDQLAVLWYVLGRAYAGIEAWPEAVISLETARQRLEAGDRSLVAHTEQPVADLFIALGHVYLGAERCADAETMLAHGLSAGASMEEHLSALEKARSCQTSDP
jgi:tetratricopeptide (TPR) repeat protein